MFYTTTGEFKIKEHFDTTGEFKIKEHFDTEFIKTKSTDNNSLDIWHYDVNGHLKSGVISDKDGSYQIWTGYCYDNGCPKIYGKNKPNLKIDKDGTTFVNKLCVGSECMTSNKLILINLVVEMMVKQLNKNPELDNKNIDDLTEAELSDLVEVMKKNNNK